MINFAKTVDSLVPPLSTFVKSEAMLGIVETEEKSQKIISGKFTKFGFICWNFIRYSCENT